MVQDGPLFVGGGGGVGDTLFLISFFTIKISSIFSHSLPEICHFFPTNILSQPLHVYNFHKTIFFNFCYVIKL